MKNDLWNSLVRFGSKHSTALFTGGVILGVIGSNILTAMGTIEAVKKIDERKKEENKETLTKKEVVETTWKCFVPTAAAVAGTTGCLFKVNAIHQGRHAAAVAALSLSETARKAFEEKAESVIGKEEVKEIKKTIAQDKVNSDGPKAGSEIVLNGNDDVLCKDSISGRYFKSSIAKLKEVQNDLNHRMLGEMYISLNEFYDAVGMDRLDIGEMIGWSIDKAHLELFFNAVITADGRPCVVVDYNQLPYYDFNKMF